MSRRRTWPGRTACALLAVALLLPAACGSDERGEDPTRPSAEALFQRLLDRVRDGGGISDASWEADVRDVASALWPIDPAKPDASAAALQSTHFNLAHIAGDMARELGAGGDAARADWMERDPGSVQIHDAFLRAMSGGMDSYRVFVEGEGRHLLEQRLEALSRPDGR